MAERIIIFDTTLRDGEQAPGASLTVDQKLEIARQLARLGVDVIEGGFPISSPGDFEAVRKIAEEVRGVTICGLARCLQKDIDAAAKALERAERPRIHVFLATSKIHREYKLQKAKEEILRMAQEGVRYAKKFVDDVEFSPEDASRTEPEFLAQVVEAVIDAGATVVNIPDTVGYAIPSEFGTLIKYLFDNVSNIERATISVHCHDDLGLAVANSLAAIENGARQVECTINGIGERAGNAALEEIVMALRVRSDKLAYETGIDTRQIYKTSRLVSKLTGMWVQPNKAIVGDNAFAHESGIHQDGVLKEPSTYEIIRPEEIGLSSSRLVLGKHSGRHAFRKKLEELGYSLDDEQIESAFSTFKELCDKKKEVFDEDIIAIVEGILYQMPETYHLEYIHTTTGNQTVPTATVRIRLADGQIKQDAACGDGPVDAAYAAISRITGLDVKLLDYSLRAITGGRDALGEVTVKIKKDDIIVIGKGTSTDIIEASAKAFVDALNRLLFRLKRAKGEESRGGV